MREYVLDKVLNVLMFCVFISQVVELNAVAEVSEHVCGYNIRDIILCQLRLLSNIF